MNYLIAAYVISGIVLAIYVGTLINRIREAQRTDDVGSALVADSQGTTES